MVRIWSKVETPLRSTKRTVEATARLWWAWKEAALMKFRNLGKPMAEVFWSSKQRLLKRRKTHLWGRKCSRCVKHREKEGTIQRKSIRTHCRQMNTQKALVSAWLVRSLSQHFRWVALSRWTLRVMRPKLRLHTILRYKKIMKQISKRTSWRWSLLRVKWAKYIRRRTFRFIRRARGLWWENLWRLLRLLISMASLAPILEYHWLNSTVVSP